MNIDITKKVQKCIKEHIDEIDEKKIQERTLDKVSNVYKVFLSSIYRQVKPTLKENIKVKNIVFKLKKKKPIKGASKQEKIDFFKVIIDEYISLFEEQKLFNEIIKSYEETLQEVISIKGWNKYEQWIGWALDFGEESYLATHIAKLTHSSSKGSSIDVRYHNSTDTYSSQYICTPEKPILDTAYPDNKYSSISQFYNIEVDGQYIGDLLRKNGSEYLRSFTKNNELLELWNSSFSKLIINENKKSYFLSKQTYFPIKGNQYHLLLPLTSSSLVHELHIENKKIWDNSKKLDIEQRAAGEQKKNKKYSPTIVRTYPNKAYIHVTGSNHSNASSLNGKRGGRIPLLPTMPPEWNSRFSSYIDKVSVFDKNLGFELKNEIDDLKKYLLLIKNKSLSISEPKRNAAVINKLRSISNNFFNFVVMINNNESRNNWSCESKLPIEQQLLFEPWREDETATNVKKDNKWKNTFSQNYGRWLNKQLNQKNKLNLTSIHEALWANACLIELREFIATREVKS